MYKVFIPYVTYSTYRGANVILLGDMNFFIYALCPFNFAKLVNRALQ